MAKSDPNHFYSVYVGYSVCVKWSQAIAAATNTRICVEPGLAEGPKHKAG